MPKTPQNIFREVVTGLHPVNPHELANITPDTMRHAELLAKSLVGKTIIHVNATPVGGGVAEMLQSQIPLERSLGLNSHWLAMEAEPDFFVITKRIHNLIQGDANTLSEDEKRRYLQVNRDLASSLRTFLEAGDFKDGILLIHDPQPLAILSLLTGDLPLRPILRLHIDPSTPNDDTMSFLKPFVEKYSRVIVSSDNYVTAFPWLDRRKIDVIQPAIDPLSPKNRTMGRSEAEDILTRLGMDVDRPIMAQVSRFDPWKGPLGVVEAYQSAKREIPELQLLMAGLATAKDDPEAETILGQVRKSVGEDRDAFLFHDPEQLGKTSNGDFINAVYTASDVIVQNSLREGFGLTMTEAMWHGRPLIAGITAGSRLQIDDGENGLFTTSPKQMSELVVDLIKNPGRAAELGAAARESVKSRYLLPHYLLANLESYLKALN